MLIKFIWWLRGREGRGFRFVYRITQTVLGSYISPSTKFSGAPCFPHGLHGIFTSEGARIGKDCVIFQHVMIVSNMLGDTVRPGAPTIGDNCYMGAGSVIVGPIRIGENVRIGANTTVYQDVPDNSVVVSGKQRNIQRTGVPNNRFYRNFKGRNQVFFDGRYHDMVSFDQ